MSNVNVDVVEVTYEVLLMVWHAKEKESAQFELT